MRNRVLNSLFSTDQFAASGTGWKVQKYKRTTGTTKWLSPFELPRRSASLRRRYAPSSATHPGHQRWLHEPANKRPAAYSPWTCALRTLSPRKLTGWLSHECRAAKQGKPLTHLWENVTRLPLEILASKDATWDERTHTVEPRYVELGYLELPAISNRILFPLDLPLLFHSFTMGYLEHLAISNCFSLPLAQINPCYQELYYVPKKVWSKSVRKCRPGISWQDVLKAEKFIDMFTVTKAKSDWLDLPLNAEGDKLPVFGDQTIAPEIWPTSLSRTPAISNNFSIPLRVRDSWVLLYNDHIHIGRQRYSRETTS